MAVLEAFVYDPLFAWKLVATAPAEPPVATEGQSFSRPFSLDHELTLCSHIELNQDRGAFGGGNRRRAEENELLRSESRSFRPRSTFDAKLTLSIFLSLAGADGREVQNEHAIKVIQRIQDKLTGRDFKATVVLPVDAQVQKLIQQATSMENLCQCFIGWCAFCESYHLFSLPRLTASLR